MYGSRERPEKFSGSGARGRRAVDRVPDFAERAATRSAACGAVQPGEQGNRDEAEHHGADGEVSHFEFTEQVRSGVARRSGATRVGVHADSATGIGEHTDGFRLFASTRDTIASRAVQNTATNQ